MNERELENFEQELRKLKTAKPPEEFIARLSALQPAPRQSSKEWRQSDLAAASGWCWIRWFAPACAVLLLAILIMPWKPTTVESNPASPAITASDANEPGIELERRLVSEFDTIAQMPGGEPVRFRCREWTDQVSMRDSASGFVLERSLPRFEMIPVRLETY